MFDTFIDEATRRVFEETIYELDRDRSSASPLHALPPTYVVQEESVRDQNPLFGKQIHESIQLTFVDEKNPSCTDGLLDIDSLPDVRIEGSQSLAWCSLVTREWLRLFTGLPSYNGPWKSGTIPVGHAVSLLHYGLSKGLLLPFSPGAFSGSTLFEDYGIVVTGAVIDLYVKKSGTFPHPLLAGHRALFFLAHDGQWYVLDAMIEPGKTLFSIDEYVRLFAEDDEFFVSTLPFPIDGVGCSYKDHLTLRLPVHDLVSGSPLPFDLFSVVALFDSGVIRLEKQEESTFASMQNMTYVLETIASVTFRIHADLLIRLASDEHYVFSSLASDPLHGIVDLVEQIQDFTTDTTDMPVEYRVRVGGDFFPKALVDGQRMQGDRRYINRLDR